MTTETNPEDAVAPRTAVRVFFLCLIVLILDGFDAQVLGYLASAIARDYAVRPGELGPAFSAGLAGMMVGGFFIGPLSDRFGRRPVMLCATAAFGVLMLCTAYLAATLAAFIALRFVTGIALGGVVLNAMALGGEYSSKRWRTTALMVIGCGYTVGAMLSGMVVRLMLDSHGWKTIFLIGGVLPIAFAVLMAACLPESKKWLAAKKGLVQASDSRVPVAQLLAPAMRPVTLLLWGVSIFNLFVMYFLSSWLPTLVQGQGASQHLAVIAGVVLQTGGLTAQVSLGPVISRLGFTRILATIFLLEVVAIVLLTRELQPAVRLAMIFVTGFCAIGAQATVNALATQYYPTEVRATGLGWMLSVGRGGSLFGPLIGGWLLLLGWTAAGLFSTLALPVLLCVLGTALLHRSLRARAALQPAAAAGPA